MSGSQLDQTAELIIRPYPEMETAEKSLCKQESNEKVISTAPVK